MRCLVSRVALAAVTCLVVACMPAAAANASSSSPGYWLVTNQGSVWPFGGASTTYGPASVLGGLHAPIVGMATTPARDGYWLVAADGGVFAFGHARFYGSLGALHLVAPITAIRATPSGHGYWLLAGDGGVFTFGDAVFYGSVPFSGDGHRWIAIAGLTREAGYALTSADGYLAICTADFHCSRALSFPSGVLPGAVGMAAVPHVGYWVVTASGGVFAYGGVHFYGSLGRARLSAPIVGMVATRDARGYWLVGADGGVFAFGDAKFAGSGVGAPAGAHFVAVAAS